MTVDENFLIFLWRSHFFFLLKLCLPLFLIASWVDLLASYVSASLVRVCFLLAFSSLVLKCSCSVASLAIFAYVDRHSWRLDYEVVAFDADFTNDIHMLLGWHMLDNKAAWSFIFGIRVCIHSNLGCWSSVPRISCLILTHLFFFNGFCSLYKWLLLVWTLLECLLRVNVIKNWLLETSC